VRDIHAAIEHLRNNGARQQPNPRKSAHGLPVIFLQPNNFCGTLIEPGEVA